MKITVQDSTGAFLVGEGSKRRKRKGKHKHHAEFERLIDSLMNGPLTSDAWEATKHPRAPNGQFSHGDAHISEHEGETHYEVRVDQPGFTKGWERVVVKPDGKRLYYWKPDPSPSGYVYEYGTPSHGKKMQGKIDEVIAAAKVGAKTHDEAPGHPFHGNQYVEVAGQQVNVPTKGSVKEKLHHLFAQGHKFTLKELAALLGQSEVTLRGRLSEIKKAAPAGGMFLEKNGEHYTLKKKEAGEIEKLIDPDSGKQFNVSFSEPEKAPEPVAAPTPSPEPVAAPVAPPEAPQTLAEKTLPDVGEFDPPATGKMPKEEADKIYKASQEKWVNTVINAGFPAVDTIEPETIKALAQGFKNNKNNGMAQWAANVKGTAQKAIEPQVFKADEQFVKDVLGGMTYANAMAAWKSNTAAEKAGTWPPDPFAAALKKEAEILATAKAEFEAKTKNTQLWEATQEHAPHFAIVSDYVPADHGGITADDFADAQGSTTFEKQQTQLKSALDASSKNSVQNKISVQHSLEEALKDSKAFQALQVQRGKQGQYNGSLAAVMVSAWAGSSGDHQPISVANQLAIRDAFDMKEGGYSLGGLDLIKKSGADDEAVYAQAAQALSCHYTTSAEKATFKAGLRDFASAMYQNTQAHFKKMGITHCYITRGSGGAVGVHKEANAATMGMMSLQPASSYSAEFSIANQHMFTKGDSLYFSKVPASQILSTYVTGYGCTGEHELLVLAHPNTRGIRVHAKHSGRGSAVSSIKATLAPETPEGKAKHAEAMAKKAAAEHKQMMINNKVGGVTPVVPKPSKYGKSQFSKAAYTAAKAGNVAATEQAVAEFVAHKAKTGSNYTYTTPYMSQIVEHAKTVAAHNAAVKQAKAELKAEAKKIAVPKPKKTQVHIHVHNEPAAPSQAQLAAAIAAKNAGASTAEQVKILTGGSEPTKVPEAWAGTPHAKLWSEFLQSGGESWIKSHPMHNEAKYKEMVAKGKTPIQIKHYYGSLKHAAQKKQGATA